MKDTRKRKQKKVISVILTAKKNRRLLITARIIFASTAHFLCGVGRQRNKNDSLDGSDRSRLSARM